jgi:GNAT superfamily N-acetyltransferase
VEIASYFSEETLPNGNRIIVRALRSEDQNDLLAAVGQVSNQSIRRRFFGPRRHFTEAEISFFVNVDFSRHVALIALRAAQGKLTIVGGARYVVENQRQAEVALMVMDEYQGQGIGGLLLRHLIGIARARGVQEFVAMVLPDNAAMLKVFRKCGIPATVTRESGVMNVTLQLD